MDDSFRYSSDRVAIVREARKRGMTDGEILRSLCRSESVQERRRIVREWAAALGLTELEALSVARREGVIGR